MQAYLSHRILFHPNVFMPPKLHTLLVATTSLLQLSLLCNADHCAIFNDLLVNWQAEEEAEGHRWLSSSCRMYTADHIEGSKPTSASLYSVMAVRY